MEFLANIVTPFAILAFTSIWRKREKLKEAERKESTDILKKLQVRLIRVELLTLLHQDPANEAAILQKYDEYLSLGGNSYMKAMIEQYKKELE